MENLKEKLETSTRIFHNDEDKQRDGFTMSE